MPNNSRNLEIRLTAVDEASGAVSKLGQTIKRELEGGGGQGPGWLKTLNESFGRRSALGGIDKLFIGGGAIAGLSLGANELKRMAEGAAKLADEFRNGEIGAAGIADGLVKGLPVVGSLYEAYKSIDELASGTEGRRQRALALQKEELEIAKDVAKVREEIVRDNAQHGREDKRFAEDSSYGNFTATHSGHSDEDEDERRHRQDAHEAAGERQRAEDEAQARLDKLHALTKPEIEKAQKAFDDAEKLGKQSHNPMASQTQGVDLLQLKMDQAAQEVKIEEDKQARLAQVEKDAKTRGGGRDAKADNDRKQRDLETARRDEKEIADAEVAARSQTLRDKGKLYDADLLELKHAHEEKLQEIQRELEKEKELHKGDVGLQDQDEDAAKRKSAAENAKYRTDVEKAKAQEATRAQQKQKTDEENGRSIRGALDDAELKVLRQKVELGDKAAGAELKRREIQKDYLNDAEKLKDVIKDPTATLRQRGTAIADLLSLKMSSEAAEARAGLSSNGPRSASASFNTQSTLSGIGQLAAERAAFTQNNPLAEMPKKQDAANKSLGDMLDVLRDTLAFFTNAGVGIFSPSQTP